MAGRDQNARTVRSMAANMHRCASHTKHKIHKKHITYSNMHTHAYTPLILFFSWMNSDMAGRDKDARSVCSMAANMHIYASHTKHKIHKKHITYNNMHTHAYTPLNYLFFMNVFRYGSEGQRCQNSSQHSGKHAYICITHKTQDT